MLLTEDDLSISGDISVSGKLKTNFYRTTPVRVATFGDSTANFIGMAGHDNTILTTPFPVSGATVVSLSADKIAISQQYPLAYVVGNGGISGQNTSQMLARDTLAASSTRKSISDIVDLRPDVILLRGGSINDLTTVTSNNLAATVAATYNNHIQIIQRFLSAGIPVIDSGIYGYNGAATDLSSTRSAITQLNALFSTYAQGYLGKVFFIDFTNLINDGAGAFLTNVFNSADGTHLSQQGQVISAKQEAAILNSLFGKSNASRFSGTNLIANANFATTTSVGYGNLATGLSIGVTNATRANAKVEMIDGRIWQTVEITVTATSGVVTINMPFTPSSMGININDIYGFEFDFYVAGMAGLAPPLPSSAGVQGRVDIYRASGGRFVSDALVTSYQNQMNDSAYMGHCVIGPLQFQEPSSNLTTSYFGFTYPTNQILTFKIGISMPRIVKLGNDFQTNFFKSGSIQVGTSSGGSKAGVMKDNDDVVTITPLSGAIYQLIGTLFTQTTTKTVTNTVSETSIIGTGSGYGLTSPINFYTLAKTLRLRIGGIYTTPIGSTPSLIIKIKCGTVVIATVTTTGLLAGATNLRFDGEIFIVCQSIGATGTVMVHGDIQYAAGLAGQVLFDPINNSGATTTINTTISNLLDVTVQWDVASTTRSVTSTVAVLETLF